MPFMQHQITDKQEWYQVETTYGTEWIPKDIVGNYPDADRESVKEEVYPLAFNEIQQYCEGTVREWETVKGYGARLSAPCYMDCTEWSVFDTVEEAQEYLDEYYPEDEDSEDEESL